MPEFNNYVNGPTYDEQTFYIGGEINLKTAIEQSMDVGEELWHEVEVDNAG